MLSVEIVCTLLGVIWAVAFPKHSARWFEFFSRKFAPIAARRWLSIVLVAIFTVALRLAVLPVEPIPVPGVHDEFSYLLMGDTFVHGRLANPTHPMWIHFETFHVIQQPTYVSIYYPAQGIFLAIGQVVFGHPFWGVVLSCALMCGAICWMLQEWVSPGWALLGGFLVALRLGTFSYWANSYWGGAVAAAGGALALGAFIRIKQHARVRDALLLAVGVALLFNSRPYESLFFTLPIAIALIVWMCGSRSPAFGLTFRKLILPVGLVLLGALGAMGFYYWRTTGSPVRTPYLVDLNTYVPASMFAWGSRHPIPQYHHDVLRTFYIGFLLDQFEQIRHHPMAVIIARQAQLAVFYSGFVLLVPIFTLALVLPSNLRLRDVDPAIRFLAFVTLCVWIGSQFPIGFVPHYDAMLTAGFYAMILLSMRRVSEWSPNNRLVGKALVSATVLVCALLVVVHVLPSPLGRPQPIAGFFTWDAQTDQMPERANITRNLLASGDNHLIIVRYSDDHNVHREWVYNDADIDASRIVWARDMGAGRNRELLDYFARRRVWLLEADKLPPSLIPYRGAASTSTRP